MISHQHKPNNVYLGNSMRFKPQSLNYRPKSSNTHRLNQGSSTKSNSKYYK